MKRLVKVQFRRRRQNKTDYFARRRLLESGIPRFIVRKTNRYIIAQIAESKEAQDKIICSTHSKELLKYGWPSTFSIKNTSAAYLTGYLCALKAIKKNIKKAILDMVEKAKSMGADAIVELKIKEKSEYYPSMMYPITLQGYDLSGFAIKRLGAFKDTKDTTSIKSETIEQ